MGGWWRDEDLELSGGDCEAKLEGDGGVRSAVAFSSRGGTSGSDGVPAFDMVKMKKEINEKRSPLHCGMKSP